MKLKHVSVRNAARLVEALHFARRHRATLLAQGLFEPDHYRAQASGRLARTDPLLDYLLFGWRRGLSPSSRIEPADLNRLYPSIGLLDPMSPLEAYIRVGRFYGLEFRGAAEKARILAELRAPAWKGGHSRIGAVVHAFYEPEFRDIVAALRDVPERFDLIVTTPLPLQVIEAALGDWSPTAMIVPMPNHGRDVFPFVHLVTHGLLGRYQILLKLHTKRSPHRADGREWFRRTIASLASPQATVEALRRFEDEPKLGLLAPHGQVMTREYLEASRRHLQRLSATAGRRFWEEDLRFPAGSAFWARSAALKPIERALLGPADFELESGQLDGTLAHAVERYFGLGCVYEGFRVEELGAV